MRYIKNQQERDALERAEKLILYKVCSFASQHTDSDVMVAWYPSFSWGWDKTLPKEYFPCYEIPVKDAQEFSETASYTYESSYTDTETHTEYGGLRDFTFEKDWKGDVHLTPNYAPDRTVKTKVVKKYTARGEATLTARVKLVKKGNGPRLYALSQELASLYGDYTNAKSYAKKGKGMFYGRKVWDFLYWADHILFFLLSFLFVMCLPGLAQNNTIYDLQLHLKIFKAIFRMEPIAFWDTFGWDPNILCWAVGGAIVALFLLQLFFRSQAQFGAFDFFDETVDTVSLFAFAFDVLSFVAVYYLPFADGVENGFVHAILMLFSWIFILLINSQLVLGIGAPVFFVWSTVEFFRLFQLSSEEKEIEKRACEFLKNDGINHFEEKKLRYDRIFAEK